MRKEISRNTLSQDNVRDLIERRKKDASITSNIACHSTRGTAITNLQSLANHASIRTTRLYDRRDRNVRRELVERIRFWE